MPTTFAQEFNSAIKAGLASYDAELLLLAATGHAQNSRAWLRVNGDVVLTQAEVQRFKKHCERRLTGEPVAYITGHRGFYGLVLAVDARVLDPRPDTETLVDWALQVLSNTPDPRVVDLGTGSGAIALAIKHMRPDAQVVAVDASTQALAVAKSNSRQLDLPVRFVMSSWLTQFYEQHQSPHKGSPSAPAPDNDRKDFDLIVSNPPYIAEGDSHLAALVHEPDDALISGPDGLNDIKLIIAQSPACLKPGAWLLLEHGHDHGIAVAELLRQQGFVNVQSRKDLAGITRCTGGEWPHSAKEG